jgi:hypothetical protein
MSRFILRANHGTTGPTIYIVLGDQGRIQIWHPDTQANFTRLASFIALPKSDTIQRRPPPGTF